MSDKELFRDFGLEDMHEDEGKMTSLGFTIFGIVVWVLLAWTTAEFFSAYASKFGERFGQNASVFVAIVGVALIDVGYIVWPTLGVKKADTTDQIKIAKWTGVILFCVSLLATVVYTTLASSFSENIVDDSTLTQLSMAGQAVIIAAVAINGTSAFLYLLTSHGFKLAEHMASVRVKLYDERHALDKQRATRTATETGAQVRKGLDSAVADVSDRNSGDYLRNVNGATAKHDSAPMGYNPPQNNNAADLHAVFQDGKQVGAATTKNDAEKQVGQARNIANRMFVPGYGKKPIYSVRPTNGQ